MPEGRRREGKHGDAIEESKLGTKLHLAFTAEVGEERCQVEVAHHAARFPEYLCSRPENMRASTRKLER